MKAMETLHYFFCKFLPGLLLFQNLNVEKKRIPLSMFYCIFFDFRMKSKSMTLKFKVMVSLPNLILP